MKKIHLTQKGYEKLVEELDHLKRVKRKEISQALAHARALGDLKENAEFHAAKEAATRNEARIGELEEKLTRVEVIDDVKIDASKVYIGAKVMLLDLESDEKIEYTLVSAEEANPVEDFISVDSPVGKSLLGHSVGDKITITVPAGDLNYKITQISR